MSDNSKSTKKKIRTPGDKWTGSALNLFSSIEEALTEAQKQDSSPAFLASEVVTGLSKVFGGRVLYIPIGYRYEREQRNREIYALLEGGMSVRDLAKKYRLSFTTIYEIIAKLTKNHDPA